VAIEFCLAINCTNFLFSDIYRTFQEKGLEDKFLLNLEPFIISGQFRKEKVPEDVVMKLIKHYEDRGKFKVLEKVIQHLDLSDFRHKEELSVLCQSKFLVSGLLYLMTSSKDGDREGCMMVLGTMMKLFQGAADSANKEDIYAITAVDSTKKFEIEKSKAYIGYKLLWTMRMSLAGRTFPAG